MTSRNYSSVSQFENNEENQDRTEKYFPNLCTSCDTSPKQRKYIGAVAFVGVFIIAIIIGIYVNTSIYTDKYRY